MATPCAGAVQCIALGPLGRDAGLWLAGGATATVWRALDLKAGGRPGSGVVALKVLPCRPALGYSSHAPPVLAAGVAGQSSGPAGAGEGEPEALRRARAGAAGAGRRRCGGAVAQRGPPCAARGGALPEGAAKLLAARPCCGVQAFGHRHLAPAQTVSCHQPNAGGLGSPSGWPVRSGWPQSGPGAGWGRLLCAEPLTGPRARAQIECASRLQHQNVARLLDVFAHGDQLVLVVRGPAPGARAGPILTSSIALGPARPPAAPRPAASGRRWRRLALPQPVAAIGGRARRGRRACWRGVS